jgi:hypothetical protein
MRATLAILLVAAAGLAVTLSWELGAFALPATRIAPHPRAAVTTAPPEAAPDHTGEWIAAFLARPVFSPDRRPAATIASTPGVRLPEGLPRLSGVLVGPFGRSAIFAADGRKPLVVDVGGHIDAWTVRVIDADAVEVSGPGGARTLHPSFASPSDTSLPGTSLPGMSPPGVSPPGAPPGGVSPPGAS